MLTNNGTNNIGISNFFQTSYAVFTSTLVSNKMSEYELKIINKTDENLYRYITLATFQHHRHYLDKLDEIFLNQLVQVYRTGYRLEIMYNPYGFGNHSLKYAQNKNLMMWLAYNCSDEDQRILGMIALTILKKRNYELHTPNSNNRP